MNICEYFFKYKTQSKYIKHSPNILNNFHIYKTFSYNVYKICSHIAIKRFLAYKTCSLYKTLSHIYNTFSRI